MGWARLRDLSIRCSWVKPRAAGRIRRVRQLANSFRLYSASPRAGQPESAEGWRSRASLAVLSAECSPCCLSQTGTNSRSVVLGCFQSPGVGALLRQELARPPIANFSCTRVNTVDRGGAPASLEHQVWWGGTGLAPSSACSPFGVRSEWIPVNHLGVMQIKQVHQGARNDVRIDIRKLNICDRLVRFA
jgi:hypothetical protein